MWIFSKKPLYLINFNIHYLTVATKTGYSKLKVESQGWWSNFQSGVEAD